MEARTEELLEYLDRLVRLNEGGFLVKNEINRCVVEIEKELRIDKWDKAKFHNIATGTGISIGDGMQGIDIKGPAKLIIVPV